MSLFSKLFEREDPKDKMIPLYQQIVAHGRNPKWYLEGGVKDTQDGRFDMIVAILALALLTLENDEELAPDSAYLTEIFVDDMDGQMRELGMGDVIVGKHVGKMVGALGGRLGVYREALKTRDMKDALVRNLYRGEAPSDIELETTSNGLLSIYDRLTTIDASTLARGEADW